MTEKTGHRRAVMVRLTEKDYHQLATQAGDAGVPVAILARSMIVAALRSTEKRPRT